MRALRSVWNHTLKSVPTGPARKGEPRARKWVCLLCSETHACKTQFGLDCRPKGDER